MANKYLHLFETVSDFLDAYNGESYEEPWVSFTKQSNRVEYNKPPFVFDFRNYSSPTSSGIELEDTDVQDFLDYFDGYEFTSGDRIRVLEPDGESYYYYFDGHSGSVYSFSSDKTIGLYNTIEIYTSDFSETKETGGFWKKWIRF